MNMTFLLFCLLAISNCTTFGSVRIVPQASLLSKAVAPVTRTLTIINPLDVEARVKYATAQNPAVTEMIKPHASLVVTILQDSMITYSFADGSTLFSATPAQIINGTLTLTLPTPPMTPGPVAPGPASPGPAARGPAPALSPDTAQQIKKQPLQPTK